MNTFLEYRDGLSRIGIAVDTIAEVQISATGAVTIWMKRGGETIADTCTILVGDQAERFITWWNDKADVYRL